MTTESQERPEHVSIEDLNAGMARLWQGLEEVDALLALAEEMVKTLLREESRETASTDAGT